MRLALVLALISGTALAQGRVYDRTCDVTSRRSSRGGVACGSVSYAQFEFAPASGAGMGAACACTTPTAATGEAMTFSRASVAWCTKGNETSGIANGDLVECASGQPRVMPGGDGTGGLGLSVWEARTNSALRSQELENAAWVLLGVTAAAPTRTANYATAPDGTATAERLQFVATGAAEGSVVYQTVGGGGVANSIGVYLKGASSAGTVDVCSSNGASYSCTACTFVAATWTRCLRENTVVAAGVDLVIGNASWRNGGTTRVANDVLVWQADQQVGATMGPPITTTSAAATRLGELADVALTFGAGTTGFSTAQTTVYPEGASPNYGDGLSRVLNGVPGTGVPGGAAASVNGSYPFPSAASLFTQDCNPSAPNTHTNARRSISGPLNRFVTYFNPVGAANLFGCVNDICDDGVAATWTAPTWTRYRLGNYTVSSGSTNAVIKKVCLDPSPLRCR